MVETARHVPKHDVDRRFPWRVVALAMIVYAIVEGLICWRYRGPEPKSADVPLTEFSAERAIEIHEELFPAKPHPSGSLQNQLVRDRLIELLRNRGWKVETQSVVVHSDEVKAQLSNVLAEWPLVADTAAKPLVLASHFDSCQSGPGAADAGGCVAAIIESATALIERFVDRDSVLPRPLFLLFTDGEELGTVGGDRFARQHRLSARKPIVINFDARGTSGPVLMYETHEGNHSAVRSWANRLARPRITGSHFAVVYRHLPHLTDFTPFQRAGWQGFNFAIIGGTHRYHMPDDTLENLDRRSVQHYGEHALSLAEHILTHPDLPASASKSNALFFDVLGWYVVVCPLAWCLPLAGALLVLMFIANFQRLRGPLAVKTFALTAVSALVVPLATAAGGWFLKSLWHDVGLLPRAFVPHGPWLCLALWLFAILTALGLGYGLLRRCPLESVWAAYVVNWSIGGLSFAVIAPEFSHLALLPVAAAVMLSIGRLPWHVRTFGLLLAVTLVEMPMQHLLAIALGPQEGFVLCPLFALLATPLYPALAVRHRSEDS